MPLKGRASLAGVALLMAVACSSSQQRAPDRQVSDGGASRLTIETSRGESLEVTIEVARTDAEKARGLMERRALAPDAGMLFVFDETDEHSFWMKNTLIALDMIFIDATGKITGIVENAEPLSTSSRSGGPSRYVLEVNGGYCAIHGVRPGDRVRIDAL